MPEPATDDAALLMALGLTRYESDAYLALVQLGVADARAVSRASGVPNGKIYDALHRLVGYGLVEVQASRPQRYAARDVGEGLARLREARREEQELVFQRLPAFEERLRAKARQTPRESRFWSVAMTDLEFVERHLTKAAHAKREYVVFMDIGRILAELGLTGESTSGEAQRAAARALEVLGEVRKNLVDRKVDFRILLGARKGEEEGARDFVKMVARPQNYGRFRVTRPQTQFHVIDRESVILILTNPVDARDALGSVFVENRRLAEELVAAFDKLWDGAKPVL